MPPVLTFTRLVVRLIALGLTVLGVILVATENLILVPIYATLAVLLTLSLICLAGLDVSRGVHVAVAVLTIGMGPVAILVSLTAEWLLYVAAGVGALAESEWLAALLERRVLAGRTVR
jgi:hypothetical protein